jgi:hypothetical protein
MKPAFLTSASAIESKSDHVVTLTSLFFFQKRTRITYDSVNIT